MRILLTEEREYKVNDIYVILLHVKIKPGQNLARLRERKHKFPNRFRKKPHKHNTYEGGHSAELVTRTLTFIFIIPKVCVTSSFNPLQLMQVTDKLEVRVSQNFVGKEPTLVLKEEKSKRQDK